MAIRRAGPATGSTSGGAAQHPRIARHYIALLWSSTFKPVRLSQSQRIAWPRASLCGSGQPPAAWAGEACPTPAFAPLAGASPGWRPAVRSLHPAGPGSRRDDNESGRLGYRFHQQAGVEVTFDPDLGRQWRPTLRESSVRKSGKVLVCGGGLRVPARRPEGALQCRNASGGT